MDKYALTVEILELGRIVRAEFAAWEAWKEYTEHKKPRERYDASVKEFRKKIDSYFSSQAFGKGKHKTIRPMQDAVDVDDNMKIINEYKVRKQNKELNDKAHRKVTPIVKEYVKLYKQALDGATVDYEDKDEDGKKYLR